jgi:hypothetical protein
MVQQNKAIVSFKKFFSFFLEIAKKYLKIKIRKSLIQVKYLQKERIESSFLNKGTKLKTFNKSIR